VLCFFLSCFLHSSLYFIPQYLFILHTERQSFTTL
jgi:hypothetical protein